MAEAIIKLGEVKSLDDETGGGRIKVSITGVDSPSTPISDLPYAFPLLPKVFQSMPKLGECVFIICAKSDNAFSQRYYLGPIISQPQEMDNAKYDGGGGNAISLIQGRIVEPREAIEDFSVTEGAFPKKNDIAVIGRKSDDIIIRDSGGEIDLRCGIRKTAYSDEEDLVGPVVFNSDNPVYIQMRYEKGLIPEESTDGVVNIVADKINFVSNKDTKKSVPLTNTDGQKNCLLDDSDMSSLMKGLHNATYGDVLVKMLEIIRSAIINHLHNLGTKPADQSDAVKLLTELNFNEILSPYVKIS